MTITVDPLFTIVPRGEEARRYGSRWCHLEDSESDVDRLHAFARSIGIPRRWFQIGKRGIFPHYDLTPRYRLKAVAAGAVELTTGDSRRLTHEKFTTNRHFPKGDARYGKKLDQAGRPVGAIALPRRGRAVASIGGDQGGDRATADQASGAGDAGRQVFLPGFDPG